MGKIVVLEGPDCGGKTTLARRFEGLGYKYVHNGVPEPGEDPFVTYTGQLVRALKAKHATVFDRLHVGELIYGKLIRRTSLLDEYQLTLLERLINASGGQTVVCLPPLRICLANWMLNRPNEYVTDSTVFRQVFHGYLDYAISHRLRVHNYLVSASFYMVESAFFGYQCPPGVIGVTRPRFLIVGERVNPRKTTYDLPFYDSGGCSKFLTEALYLAGYEERELAFTNAYANGSVKRFGKIIEALHDPAIICLGKLAYKVVTAQLPMTQVHQVPHPAYWKRFHNHNSPGYVQLLKEVRDAD